jgi:hypothetical protein
MCLLRSPSDHVGLMNEEPLSRRLHMAFGGIKSRLWLFQNRDKGYRKCTPLPGSFQKLANRLPARLCGLT